MRNLDELCLPELIAAYVRIVLVPCHDIVFAPSSLQLTLVPLLPINSLLFQYRPPAGCERVQLTE